jgi:hypothetical protein
MIGPMPGTLTNRSQPASWRVRAVISPDKQSIRSSNRRQSGVLDGGGHGASVTLFQFILTFEFCNNC